MKKLTKVLDTVSFSTVDMKSVYCQISIVVKDKPFTAFEANGQQYQYCRLHFGVTNGVSVGPVALGSRTLTRSESHYPAIEKEAASFIEAVRKWSHYFHGKAFNLVTDQKSLFCTRRDTFRLLN